MSKNIVISGYYGFGNFGDELILSILVQHLKQKNYNITVLSSNPQKTSKEHYVNSIHSFDISQAIKVIKNSDILISGGGSLLQDATSLKSLLYYLFIILTALFFKKEIIIFAQGIGPIKNHFARIFTKFILKQCTFVSVRDSNSKNLLNEWGIKSELLCDPAFSLPIEQRLNKGIIGIQLREFPTVSDEFLRKLANSIVKEFEHKTIRLLPLQDSKDKNISIKFQNMLLELNPNIKIEIVSENIISNILELEYLIGMRFHALLIAIKAGIKCTAINYDIKVEKLAQDAKIPIISMKAEDNMDEIFYQMKNIESYNLQSFSQSHAFDWTGIDLILEQ